MPSSPTPEVFIQDPIDLAIHQLIVSLLPRRDRLPSLAEVADSRFCIQSLYSNTELTSEPLVNIPWISLGATAITIPNTDCHVIVFPAEAAMQLSQEVHNTSTQVIHDALDDLKNKVFRTGGLMHHKELDRGIAPPPTIQTKPGDTIPNKIPKCPPPSHFSSVGWANGNVARPYIICQNCTEGFAWLDTAGLACKKCLQPSLELWPAHIEFWPGDSGHYQKDREQHLLSVRGRGRGDKA